MRKRGGTSSRRQTSVTLVVITPPSDARCRFVGVRRSGLVGCKTPSLLHARSPRGTYGAPPQDEEHLSTYLPLQIIIATFVIGFVSHGWPANCHRRLYCLSYELSDIMIQEFNTE